MDHCVCDWFGEEGDKARQRCEQGHCVNFSTPHPASSSLYLNATESGVFSSFTSRPMYIDLESYAIKPWYPLPRLISSAFGGKAKPFVEHYKV